MPPAQFAQQSVRLQFDTDVHFGDDIKILLPRLNGDIMDTLTLRIDWPVDMPTTVQYSTGTAMIERVELLYKNQMIERHYGESMFLLGEVTVPEAKQSALSNLLGTHTTSNLASYFIQFPFTVKLPIVALDESPVLRIVFQPSTYFAGVVYTNAIAMNLYINYIYVTQAERDYFKSTPLSYPVKTFQRVEFRIPYTLTTYTCETSFVNMVKELFWVIQEDQYTSNIYKYSSDLVSFQLLLDGDDVIMPDVGTPQFLTVLNKHTRTPTSGFYSYSFEIDPESDQENGALNMSAVTRQIHMFTLTQSPVWRSLRIYAHSYNIFHIENGQGTVVYSLQEAGNDTYSSDIAIPYVAPLPPPPPLYAFTTTFLPQNAYKYFGEALAINSSGSTAVIGAAGTGLNTGVVIVLVTSDGNYTELHSSFGINSYFGYAVDISDDGNTVIVGIPAANLGHGSANVFTYSGGTWIGSPLISSYANFTFGWSVALNGNGSVAVVGAPQAFGYAGYAAVFQGGVEIPLTSTASVSPAYFGYSVSINDAGTSVVVGAPSACYAAVYKQTGGVWGPAQVLVSGLSRPVNFGWSVYYAPTADVVIVGAPNNETANVFSNTGSGWSTSTLTSSAGPNASFGSAVALSADGTIAVVGAPTNGGYAAAFIQTNGTWSLANVIQNTTGDTNAQFGSSLSISHTGSVVLIGAYGYNNGNGYTALYTSTN